MANLLNILNWFWIYIVVLPCTFYLITKLFSLLGKGIVAIYNFIYWVLTPYRRFSEFLEKHSQVVDDNDNKDEM